MSEEAPDNRPTKGKTAKFGPFRLIPRRRLLLAGEEEIRIGGRALDILVALVERAGQLVSKEELISRVWPHSVVEEINLRVHIAGLRRALEDGRGGGRYIVNTVGRGYCFVAPIDWEAGEPDPETPVAAPMQPTRLPASLKRMLGRDADVQVLGRKISTHRLITVVGPAGVGKTTLALACAQESAPRFEHGAHYVDLATISQASQVGAAIAAGLQLTSSARDARQHLLSRLHDRHLLLLVDHGEHVIAAVAAWCEDLLKSAPRLHVLAVSRAALGSEAEYQHCVHPLDVPPEPLDEPAESIRRYPAVALFVERATATLPTFALHDSNAASIGDICRRLDGIPLAIELAAARVNLLNVRDIAGRLDSQFLDFSNSRRTVAARHRTMRAALDPSMELLSASEQILFRRLAVFRGAFELGSAVALAGREGLDRHQVCEGLLSLAEKSLISTVICRGRARHRFLHSTRTYALERLIASTDGVKVFRWHAGEMCRVLQKAAAERESVSHPQWIGRHEYVMSDAEAALEWAQSPAGDPKMYAAIAALALPLLSQATDRMRQWVREAPRKHPDIAARSLGSGVPLSCRETT